MREEIFLETDEVQEEIYAGFGPRLAAALLDGLLLLPVYIISRYFGTYGVTYQLSLILPYILLIIWLEVFMVKKYGGSPGKLMVNIKIIKLNGSNLGWREAMIRFSVSFFLLIFNSALTALALMAADADHYESLKWKEQHIYLTTLYPIHFLTMKISNNIWTYGELIFLLTNKKKRAIHDFMAGTVVVKTAHLTTLRERLKETSGVTV
jgi:uncharacterized RDD family membrane protein YckC